MPLGAAVGLVRGAGGGLRMARLLSWIGSVVGGQAFIARASILTGGTLGAQMVGLLAMPFVAVLYGPAAYGQFAVVQAIAGILSAAALLRYDEAVVQAESERDAGMLARLAVVVSLGLLALAALILAMFWGLVTPTLGLEPLGAWWLPTAIGSAGLTAWSTVTTAVLIRRHSTTPIAGSRIVQSLSGVAVQIAAGVWLGAKPLGLVGGLVVGQLLACLMLWAASRRAPVPLHGERADAAGGEGRWQAALADYLDLARRFQDFPSHAAPTVILNTVSLQLLPIVISAFFGPALAGAVALTQRLTQFPVMLITAQIWQLIFARLRDLDRAARRSLLRKVYVAASFGFALPLAVVAVNAEPLIALLGEHWSVVRPEYLAAFSLLAWMNGASNAISYFSAFQLFREEAVMNVLFFFVRMSSIAAPAIFFSARIALFVYTASCAFFYFLIILYWARALIGLRFALWVMAAALVVSLAGATLLNIVLSAGMGPAFAALLAVSLASAVVLWFVLGRSRTSVSVCARSSPE